MAKGKETPTGKKEQFIVHKNPHSAWRVQFISVFMLEYTSISNSAHLR